MRNVKTFERRSNGIPVSASPPTFSQRFKNLPLIRHARSLYHILPAPLQKLIRLTVGCFLILLGIVGCFLPGLQGIVTILAGALVLRSDVPFIRRALVGLKYAWRRYRMNRAAATSKFPGGSTSRFARQRLTLPGWSSIGTVAVLLGLVLLARVLPTDFLNARVWLLRPLSLVPFWPLAVSVLLLAFAGLTPFGAWLWRRTERAAVRVSTLRRLYPILTFLLVSGVLASFLFVFRVRVQNLGDIDIIPWDTQQLRFATVAHLPLEGLLKLWFCQAVMFISSFSIETSLALYSILLGLFYFWALSWACGTLRTTRRRKLLTFLVVFLAPTLQLYAGYPEHYGIAHAAHVVYVFLAIAILQGRATLPLASVWLALAISANLALGLLLPSMLFLSGCVLYRTRYRFRTVAQILSALLLGVGFGSLVWQTFRVFNPYNDPIIERVMGGRFHGLGAEEHAAAVASLFDLQHLLDLLNELLFTSWPAWVLCLSLALHSARPTFARRGHAGSAAKAALFKAIPLFLFSILLCLIPLFLTWVSSFSAVSRDWDLYAFVAPAVTACLLYFFLWRRKSVLPQRALGTAVLFSALFTSAWILGNADVFARGPRDWFDAFYRPVPAKTVPLFQEHLQKQTFVGDTINVCGTVRQFLQEFPDRRPTLAETFDSAVFDRALGQGTPELDWFTDIAAWHDERFIVSTLDARMFAVDIDPEGQQVRAIVPVGFPLIPPEELWSGTEAIDLLPDGSGMALDSMGHLTLFALTETHNGVWTHWKGSVDLRPHFPATGVHRGHRISFSDLKCLGPSQAVVMDSSSRFRSLSGLPNSPQVEELYDDDGTLLSNGIAFDLAPDPRGSEPIAIAVIRRTQLAIFPRRHTLSWMPPLYDHRRDYTDLVVTHAGSGALGLYTNGAVERLGRAERWAGFDDWQDRGVRRIALAENSSCLVGLTPDGRILVQAAPDSESPRPAETALTQAARWSASAPPRSPHPVTVDKINNLAHTAEGRADTALAVDFEVSQEEEVLVLDRWGRLLAFEPGVGYRWLIERNPWGCNGELGDQAVGFVQDPDGITVATTGGDVYRIAGNLQDGFESQARFLRNPFESERYMPYVSRKVVSITQAPYSARPSQESKVLLLDSWQFVHDLASGKSWRLYPNDWSASLSRIAVSKLGTLGPRGYLMSSFGNTSAWPPWSGRALAPVHLPSWAAVSLLVSPDEKAIAAVDSYGAVHGLAERSLKGEPYLYRDYPNVVDAHADWERKSIWMLDRAYGVRWGGLQIGERAE